jgi:hypothetical protein
VRRAAVVVLLYGIVAVLTSTPAFADSLTLAWDPSSDSGIAGYNVYYGVASRTYTNMISVGTNTVATISNLVEGVTYYFAATTYDINGLESDFSDEISYTVPVTVVNQPPTLNTLANLTINENAGLQAVNLTGISSGATNETQTLTITATSSNPGLIPNPTVSYSSPNTTGTLTFSPVSNGNGLATISVTVNDGGASNNTVFRSFTVTVNPVNQPPTLNTPANLTINENGGLQTVSLTGISSGATNETQTLTVTATSSNPGLISNPSISYTSPNTTGTLTFTPVSNGNGLATISVTVNDGGVSNNTVSRSFSVTVNPVNQPPTLNTLANLTINENGGLQTVSLTGISSGATNETQTLTVTATSSNPGLIPNPTVSYSSPNTTGTLTFTPVSNGNGLVTISVTVNDGGVSNNTVSRSFTVTVNPVNQAPTLNTPANLTINENGGLQTVSLTGISSGATNETQTLSITATSSNPGLISTPTVSYTSPNTTGTLTFTPVNNGNGLATISVTVSDGGVSNNTVSRSFTVTVNPVNQPPTLNALTNLTINENGGLQTVNLTGISSGATNETQTLTITATSSNPGLIPNPIVSYTSPNTTGTLTFTPVSNGNGLATISVTVNDGGVSNNTVSRSFTVTVNPVNQPPTLNALTNLTINENGGLQTVSLNGISSGATNETQTLTVTATSSNPGLISNPAISYTSPNTTGTLTFTPVSNGNGLATISVTVNDGGASSNTVSQSFTVTVNPVNQPPTLNTLTNLTINENASLQTVNLTGISSGATNETQTLSITATSSNPGLIPNPTVNYTSPNTTGTLTFTPVNSSNGLATITVTVNDGGVSNNTVFRSFAVAVNAPPTISAISNRVIATSTSTVPIAFTIGDAETTASNLTLSATSSNPALVDQAAIVFGGADSNRTVTITPVTGQTGVVNITITVSDGIATASSAFQLSVQPKPAPPGNFHIAIDGNGTISPNLSQQSLVVGQTYTVTAVPAEGQEFSGWSGSVTSTNATISFMMAANLSLRAKFVPSPFSAVQATYHGLFYQQDTNQDLDLVRQESSGAFTVSTTKKSKYTGSLQIGSTRYSFHGILDPDGCATNTIHRHGASDLTLQLQLGAGSQAEQAFGHLTDGIWTATLGGDRAVFNSKTNRASFAGAYTVVLPGQDGDPSVPAGNGFGSVRVNPNGLAALAGTLADGTKVSQSVSLSRGGQWPLYIPLYSGKGSVLSWLTFTNLATNDLDGALSWIKPSNPHARYYAAGLTNQCMAVGSTYVAPRFSTNQVLNLDAASVEFCGGDLTNAFTNSVAFLPTRIVFESTNRLSLSFSRSTGTFRGTVIDPTSGKSLSFSGAVLQKQGVGYGLMLGAAHSACVVIAP